MRKRLAQLRQVSSVASLASSSESGSQTASSSSPAASSAAVETDEELRERGALRKDEDAVEEEILKWKKMPKLSDEELDSKDFSLVRFWQVGLFCFGTLISEAS